MDKWADYLISEVSYDSAHLIYRATRYADTKNGIREKSTVDRLTIASDISSDSTYMTIYNTPTSWKKGNKLRIFRIDGQPYIRIDCNKAPLDFLGDIAELQGHESELEQTILESKPDPAPAPTPNTTKPSPNTTTSPNTTKPSPEPKLQSPRGSLPKPDPAPAPTPNTTKPSPNTTTSPNTTKPSPEPKLQSPRGSLPKPDPAPAPTPNTTKPSPNTTTSPNTTKPSPEPKLQSPRGSLPKPDPAPAPTPNTTKPSPEPKLQSPRGSLPKPDSSPNTTPKPTPESTFQDMPGEYEEPATDDQLTRFNNLKTQIDNLEKTLINYKLMSEAIYENKIDEPAAEYISEQPTQLPARNSDLEEPEPTPTGTSHMSHYAGTFTESKSESSHHNEDYVQTLQNQSKKLNDMANKLQTLDTGPGIHPVQITAYCVKCKEKHPISNPQNTVMKNGRHAIKGICSICGSKVFRIIKASHAKQ